ncbi:MAG: hypothetical protein ACRDJO_04380, partial [Actinomycetota bacterium]
SVRGAGGNVPAPRLRPVAEDGLVEVVEDAGHLPRVLVVDRARAVGDVGEAIAVLSRGAGRFADGAVRVRTFDPRSEAVVEARPGELAPFVAAAGEAGGGGASRAEIASYESDRVEVVVRAVRPGLLVLTDVFYPGWKATVNGRPALIHPVDVAFRGVGVGEGTSTVVFTYEPASFRIGVAAAGAGILAAAFLLLGGRRAGGSRPPTARGGAPGGPGGRASRTGTARGRPAT